MHSCICECHICISWMVWGSFCVLLEESKNQVCKGAQKNRQKHFGTRFVAETTLKDKGWLNEAISHFIIVTLLLLVKHFVIRIG